MWKEHPNQEPVPRRLCRRIARFLNRPQDLERDPIVARAAEVELREIESQLLPRRWNPELLSGYITIAVDQRHPIWPEDSIRYDQIDPPLPSIEPLLADPYLVRFERLRMEWHFRGDNRRFGEHLEQVISNFAAPMDRDQKLLSALLADYQADPHAWLHHWN